MYYVDLFIGLDLSLMLQDTAYLPLNMTYDNTTYQPAISLVMHPAVGGFPSAWEFTLIIVVALLAISFLASGKCYLFTSRRVYIRIITNTNASSSFLLLIYLFFFTLYHYGYISFSGYALAFMAY